MPNLQPRDQVGDYILQEALDEGGQGYIWRARHAETGALVAIKLLTKPSSGGETGQLRQDIELMAAAAANHSPNIVHVLGGGLEPVPHIVMEYIDGSDLRKELIRLRELHGENSDGFAQDEVIRVGIAVAGALKLLHQEGIIHRDVKPANVMLDRRGNIKLTDFGIAKIIGYHSVSIYGDHPLSLAYASPEVWSGEPVPASDIYALGATLWELLTGHPPFQGFAASLYTKHTSEKPDLDSLPPGTVGSLRVLLERCLEKEIGARPRAETCLALLNAANAETDEALSSPSKHEPRRFGDWTILSPLASQPWAWHCVHRESRIPAILEVEFVASLADLGEALRHARRAIDINPRLVLHGAERLFAADRVMLGPDEAWPGVTPGPFAYFIAREDAEPPNPPTSVSRVGLKAIATSLAAMARIAEREDISLSFDADELVLVNQNAVRVARPCLVAPAAPASDAGLVFLRSLPLDEATLATVMAAQSLADLVDVLGEQDAASPDAAVAGTLILDAASLQQTRQADINELAAPRMSEPAPVLDGMEAESPAAPAPNQTSDRVSPPGQVTIGPRSVETPIDVPPAVADDPALQTAILDIAHKPTTTGSVPRDPEVTPVLVAPVVVPPPAPLPGGFSLAIEPKRSSTRFRPAQFEIALTSLSDRPQTITLRVLGPQDVDFALPSQVTLTPSGRSAVVVTAKPRESRWWGERRTRSFTIAASGGDDGKPPRTVDANFHDDSKNWLPISGGLGAVVLAVVAFASIAGGGGGKHKTESPSPANAAALLAKATVEASPTATSTAVPTAVPQPEQTVAEAAAPPPSEPAPPPPPGATATRVLPTPTARPVSAPAAPAAPAVAQAPAPPPAAPPAPAPTTAPAALANGESYAMIGFSTTKTQTGTAPADTIKSGASLSACSSTYFYMFFTVRNATVAKPLTFTYSVEGNRIGTYSFTPDTGTRNYWFGFPINQPRNGQSYRVTTGTSDSTIVLDGGFTLKC